MLCSISYKVFWRMLCVYLRGMCILLLLVGMFHNCLFRSICSKVWFKSSVSLFIFCLGNLSIAENRVLKSFTFALMSIFLFTFVSICLMHLAVPMLCAYIYLYFLINWALCHHIITFIVLCYCFLLKDYFIWYKLPLLFFYSSSMKYFFSPLWACASLKLKSLVDSILLSFLFNISSHSIWLFIRNFNSFIFVLFVAR